MANNQELTQEEDISNFKKEFLKLYGVKLYIYSPTEKEKRKPISIFHDVALDALHESMPRFRNIKSLQNKTRLRDYLVYVQVMSYLAHKEGHSKTSIGKFLNRNHATVINSCKMIENGFFSKDKTVLHAYNNTLKKLEEYVGTISENDERENDTKPVPDPIWDKARRFIA